MIDLPAAPDVPAGSVLVLSEDDWRYGEERLTLRVERVRHDLSRYYDNEWVWIEGETLGSDGSSGRRVEALVRVAAIPRALARQFCPK